MLGLASGRGWQALQQLLAGGGPDRARRPRAAQGETAGLRQGFIEQPEGADADVEHIHDGLGEGLGHLRGGDLRQQRIGELVETH